MWSSSLFGGCCIPYEDPKQLYKCFTVANKYLFSFAKRLCIVVGVSFTIALVEFHRIAHLFGLHQCLGQRFGFCEHHEK